MVNRGWVLLYMKKESTGSGLFSTLGDGRFVIFDCVQSLLLLPQAQVLGENQTISLSDRSLFSSIVSSPIATHSCIRICSVVAVIYFAPLLV